MIDFSPNIYIIYKSNIGMAPSYMKGSKKTVFIVKFPDIQIQLFSVLPISVLPLAFPCLTVPCKKIISFSS